MTRIFHGQNLYSGGFYWICRRIPINSEFISLYGLINHQMEIEPASSLVCQSSQYQNKKVFPISQEPLFDF
jgi:hypothetical protein